MISRITHQEVLIGPLRRTDYFLNQGGFIMKKVLVILVLCLALFGSLANAQRQVSENVSYDETSICIYSNVEYCNLKFGVIESYKGNDVTVQFQWYGTDDIMYRYMRDDGSWSNWQSRSLNGDSVQCLVFRDAWYVIKGYPYS